MIYVFMGGRLGNQLFRYACARKLKMDFPEKKIVLDFERVSRHRKEEEDYLSSLLDLNIADCEVINNEEPYIQPYDKVCQFLKKYNGYIKKIGIDSDRAIRWRKQLVPLFQKYNVIYSDDFSEFNFNGKGNIYIYGCVESERYFGTIRNILLEEMKPKAGLREKYGYLLETILETNAVCISVRRWSLIHPEQNEIMGVCSQQYYKNAINIVEKFVVNPTFFVFSNDMEWVRDSFECDGRMVIYEPEGLTICEKIILMTACKHFIIPNSTFGWWIQYLAVNENKIVIAPDKWNNVKYREPELTLEYFNVLKRNEYE